MAFFICLMTILFIITSYLKWIRTYWKRRGIDGPSGFPLMGSFYELASSDYPRTLVIHDWTKKFGKVFGYYEGTVPVLVVSNMDMLQELFIEKFDYFYARKSTNHIHGDLESTKEEPRVNLFTSRGARWKRLRALASPAFSVKGLKQVHHTMEDSVLAMIGHMDKHKNGGPFNIHAYYQEFTYDVINRLAMGRAQSEQWKNKDVEVVKQLFLRTHRVFPWYLTVMFPFLQSTVRKVFWNHKNIRGGDVDKIFKYCEKSVLDRIAERAKNAKLGIENPHNDFIDMLLDHYTENEIQDQAFGTQIEKKVTCEDVIGSCFIFLLAGFDTTANTLGYITYLLAKHPEKMRMAQEEVDSICTSESISYDDISKFKYVNGVVKEALRLYPVAWFACSRECVTTTTLGGIRIEKGTFVEADVAGVHLSKEVWGENANEFVPERWLEPETRHKMSWIPFGAGLRTCVGMRLGLAESKTAIAHILRRYSIVGGPKTEEKLKIKGCTTNSPEKVTVYLKSRF